MEVLTVLEGMTVYGVEKHECTRRECLLRNNVNIMCKYLDVNFEKIVFNFEGLPKRDRAIISECLAYAKSIEEVAMYYNLTVEYVATVVSSFRTLVGSVAENAMRIRHSMSLKHPVIVEYIHSVELTSHDMNMLCSQGVTCVEDLVKFTNNYPYLVGSPTINMDKVRKLVKILDSFLV